MFEWPLDQKGWQDVYRIKLDEAAAKIIKDKDLPAKEGTIALCGAKLMGMDLKGDVQKANCDKCLKIMRQELS